MSQPPIMMVMTVGRATVTFTIPDGAIDEVLEIMRSPYGLTAERVEYAYDVELRKREPARPYQTGG